MRFVTTDKSNITIDPSFSDMPALELPAQSNFTEESKDEAKAYRLGECIARAMSAQQIEVLDPPSHWRQIGARTDAAKWVQAQKNHIEKIKKQAKSLQNFE